MKKPIVILFAILISVFACNAQDIIFLKTGEEIKATITEVGVSEIKYKKFGFEDGPAYIQLKANIVRIKYANGSEDIFSKPVKVSITTEQPMTSDSITSNTNHRAHAVYAEALGNSIIWSFNYDVRFGRKRNGFGARAGIGYTTLGRGSSVLTAPIMLNYLAGNKDRLFELGLGIVVYVPGQSGIDLPIDIGSGPVIGTVALGLRKQREGAGLMWRMALTPVFGIRGYSNYYGGNTTYSDEFFFWPFFGGMSIGYVFY